MLENGAYDNGVAKLGTCAYCGYKGRVQYTGRRWLCTVCWVEQIGGSDSDYRSTTVAGAAAIERDRADTGTRSVGSRRMDPDDAPRPDEL